MKKKSINKLKPASSGHFSVFPNRVNGVEWSAGAQRRQLNEIWRSALGHIGRSFKQIESEMNNAKK